MVRVVHAAILTRWFFIGSNPITPTSVFYQPSGLVFLDIYKGDFMSWYTLQTNPNYENKVIEQIWQKIKENDISQIVEVFSPEESIVEFKNGQKKEKKKKLYSNYIFINMEYSPEVWHKIRGIKGLVGFVGNKDNPHKVPESQIEAMKAKINGTAPKPKIMFDIDSKVKIKEGSFADFYGVVKSTDYEKNKVKIMVNIFNRETVVDLDLTAIEVAK